MRPRTEYSRNGISRRGLSGPVLSGPGRLAVAAAALGCVAAAAGCSSSGSPSAAPTVTTTVTATAPAASSSAPTTLSPTTAGTSACPNGSLQVKLGVAQGYAGGVYQVIDFTNTSGTACTLLGYPGVSLVAGPSKTQIGLAAKRSTTTPVKQITLAPGATASAQLQIVDALNFPSASCGPTKATALRIYPPNQTASVLLPNSSNSCAEPVQIMFVGAVQPGSGSSS
jgi:Protein of unknown function (DUF4232)